MSHNKEALAFASSAQYWDDRYRLQGNSGAGSYGRLAAFKAEVLNHFVDAHAVQSVMEFGCGDGNQLSLARYPRYIGYDVAEHALARCRARFADDASKTFFPAQSWQGETAELVLSLDVIYHLVEDAVFERYMTTLFAAAERYVVIYASNDERLNSLLASHVKHVRHRKFTDWIVANIAAPWQLKGFVPNRYPFDRRDQTQTSFADFYLFSKGNQ